MTSEEPVDETPQNSANSESKGADGSRQGAEIVRRSIALEIVVQSVADARAAQAGGADRLELCVGLTDGGLTPPATLMERVIAAVDLPVFVMIRPRAGDFVLDDEDLELMRADIRVAREAGAAGVVLGALTPDGEIDMARLGRLVACARPLPVTFHRAFDHTCDPQAALEGLGMLGIERVLTSGHSPSACEGIQEIAGLVAQERRRPQIVAGGGVRSDNVANLVTETGVTQVHSSARGHRPSPARHVNHKVPLGPTESALRRVVEAELVREIVTALESVS